MGYDLASAPLNPGVTVLATLQRTSLEAHNCQKMISRDVETGFQSDSKEPPEIRPLHWQGDASSDSRCHSLDAIQ